MVQYTPSQSLDALDQAGVKKAFLSLPLPFGDDRIENQRDAKAVARQTNEFGAKIVADFRGRFGLFAVLPLPDVDASLRKIEYAFDTLNADGVGLVTSYGNRWLGDHAFEPVFDELNRRKAVVYLAQRLAGASPAGPLVTRVPQIRFRCGLWNPWSAQGRLFLDRTFPFLFR